MTNITQDMFYRLSLIKYAEKYGVTKPQLGIKLTGSISTAGNVASTALWSPYDIVPEDLTAIQISIRLRKLSL